MNKFKIGDLVKSIMPYGMTSVVFEIVSLGGETCHLLPSCRPGKHYHVRSLATGKIYCASEKYVNLHLLESELTPEEWFKSKLK